MKTVMVFGVFDGIHEGHRFFLQQARMRGDRVVAIVARDTAVFRLKGKNPHRGEQLRLQNMLDAKLVDEALLGDEEMGRYTALEAYHPQIIALGYDQEALERDLLSRRGQFSSLPEICGISAHKPEQY